MLYKAEEILIDNMPIIPLYTYVRSYQLSPDVKGFNPHILDHHHPKFIYLERDWFRMLAIFIKRILIAIPVLFAVASITFFLIKIAPGGPFDADRAVSPQVLKNLNEAYNLDASNWEQ